MFFGKTMGKVLVGGAAVLALSGAGQAFAAGAGESLDSTVNGAYTWSHGTNGQVAVKDTLGDGHSVYSLYDRRYNTGLRLDNSGGHGTTAYSGLDETNYVRKVTACVNISLAPDRCGPDDRPGDGV
ncbi:hypothetical protein SAMN05216223_11047 [Actinacidiphila yanglinensis]|uniref:Uncharacterized protein n=1 Tax=Actinacidiphila yanglinensis TaxID=310779 RepID=A0A1H6CT71_9ACTN|nr:hypothetical protein [Actinacidiphila yanglinensis]SEG76078.1 hypothetical protein SAMN05216223_11047 [Actinacidiphila yanglinensis]